MCADFSEDGSFLAYAIGYDWSKGAEGLKEKPYVNKLFLRTPDIGSEVFKPGKWLNYIFFKFYSIQLINLNQQAAIINFIIF